MNRYDVIIVGAGASGMACAIEASKRGAKVLLLEKQERSGKKILVTGNGRCNYTNAFQSADCYRGEHPEFVSGLLRAFGQDEIRAWMTGLGVRETNRGGYYYPATGQAQSVADCLLRACRQNGAEIITGQAVVRVVSGRHGWTVETETDRYEAQSVVLACGSDAGTRKQGNALKLLTGLDLRVIPVSPALVKLMSDAPYLGTWKGVRVDGTVTLFIDGAAVTSDTGEIQLTEDGISGIPVFQISRFAARACRDRRKTEVRLDIIPEWTEEQVAIDLEERFATEMTVTEALGGLIHRKLIPLYLRQAGIRERAAGREVTASQRRKLAHAVKNLTVPITGTGDLASAQVAAGGLDTTQVDPETMEVRGRQGLYVTGELLDIDGICGGYNLHFAWMTGITAGRHVPAGEFREKKRTVRV